MRTPKKSLDLRQAWPIVRATLTALRTLAGALHHVDLAIVLQVLVAIGNAVAKAWRGKRRR